MAYKSSIDQHNANTRQNHGEIIHEDSHWQHTNHIMVTAMTVVERSQSHTSWRYKSNLMPLLLFKSSPATIVIWFSFCRRKLTLIYLLLQEHKVHEVWVFGACIDFKRIGYVHCETALLSQQAAHHSRNRISYASFFFFFFFFMDRWERKGRVYLGSGMMITDVY